MAKPVIRISDVGWMDANGDPEQSTNAQALPNPHKPKIKNKPLGEQISPRDLYERQQAQQLNPDAQAIPLPNSDTNEPQFMAPNKSPHHEAARQKLIEENKLPSDAPVPEPTAKTADTQQPINRDPEYVSTRQNHDKSMMRVGLPSKFIFYDFNDLQMRPFVVRDLSKLSRAQAENNINILIDVIDGTIDRDVRALTVPDFYYLMYMLRIWSYPKSPFTLKWVSKYGNKNEHTINQTNLKIKHPVLTRDDYAEWQARGYAIPTVRDMEIFQTETLDLEFKWEYERAQYLAGSSIKEKMNRLNGPDGMDILVDIREFSKLLDHGVEETIEVRDSAFNSKQHLASLQDKLAQLKQANYKSNPELVAAYNRISQEHEELSRRAGRGFAPADPEVIRISVDLMSFFPDI